MLRMVSIDAVSPHGVKMTISTSSPTGSLLIDRDGSQAAFVDIRDDGAVPHEDGYARLVAQVPASWFLGPHWEETSSEPAEKPKGKTTLRGVN